MVDNKRSIWPESNIFYDFDKQQNISIQFLFIFYTLFLINPIAIFVTQKIYFAYMVIIFFALLFLISIRIYIVLNILSTSKYLILLFIVINTSILWTLYFNDTVLHLAIFSHIPVIYISLSITILFSNTSQRSSICVFIPFLCFFINIILWLNFGTVRAYHHDMKEVVQSYSNHMAAMMEFCLPLLFYRLKCKFTKHLTVAAIALSFFNIAISESRGGLVTLFLFLVLMPFLYFRGKTNRRITFLLVISLVFFTAISIYYFGIYEYFEVLKRFSEFESVSEVLSSSDPSSLSARLLMYYHGTSLILSHPILGLGWGSFSSSMSKLYGTGVIAHNLIIEIWSSCGILGFGILTLTLYTAFKRLYQHYLFHRKRNIVVSDWCLANILCLVLLCFHGLFRPFLTNILLYFPLAEAFVFTRINHSGEYD